MKTTEKAKYFVRIPIEGKQKEDESFIHYFEDVEKALDFYATQLKYFQPVKWYLPKD